jgi:hypothetical protein
MKFIKGFDTFILESQSKKLKKYLSFSVVLKWYRENKHTIASILGVAPEELASEDDLLDQSHGLIKNVINTQTNGNRGTDFRVGFSEFKPIEQNLIHDILHNIYAVQKKTFTKSLDRVEFSESEIIEEIECLGLEESFMKYMNIKYLKTDFINQNINQLVSHLMIAILFYDANRVAQILDGEKEPYLEVYGEEYPVKGTPFEGVYDLFKNTEADNKFSINSSEELKSYLIHILNIGEGIDVSNGDRAEYPDGGYYGQKSLSELDSEDAVRVRNDFNETNRYFKVNDTYTVESLIDSGFYHEFRAYLEVVWDEEHDDFDDFNYQEINVDTEEEAIFYFSQFEEEEGSVDYEKYLAKQGLSKRDVFEYNNEDVIIFIDDELASWDDYNNKLYDFFEFGNYYDMREYDYNNDFIDINYWEKQEIQAIVNAVIRNDNARSILRRNFRTNDIVKNNTKLGKNDTSNRKNNWSKIGAEKIDKGTKGYTYFDFFGEYDYTSLSKNLFSNNAKKLTTVLNSLRGYVIKNIDQIKTTHKENNQKFSQEDINMFKNSFKSKSDFDFSKLYEIDSVYNTDFFINNVDKTNLSKLADIFKFQDFVNKITSDEDIDYIFNWVNKGYLNNKSTFKQIITDIKELFSKFNYLDDDTIKLIKNISGGKIKIDYDMKDVYACKTNNDIEELVEKYLINYYNGILNNNTINITISKIEFHQYWVNVVLRDIKKPDKEEIMIRTWLRSIATSYYLRLNK